MVKKKGGVNIILKVCHTVLEVILSEVKALKSLHFSSLRDVAALSHVDVNKTCVVSEDFFFPEVL